MSDISNLIQSMTDRVESVGSCEDLKDMSAEILSSLEGLVSAFTAQIASLATIAPLMLPPTSPAQAQAWIGAYIATRLVPIQESGLKAQSQLPEVVDAISNLADTVQKKASEFNNCSIVG